MANLKKLLVVLSVSGLLVWLFWTPTLVAQHDLHDGQVVRMEGQPLFGFQSDWSRRLVISDGRSTKTLELFEDTGWWRGSALYRDAKGKYLLNDGMDYVTFLLCPPQFTMTWMMSTGKKVEAPRSPAADDCKAATLEPVAPPSKYETKDGPLYFLGVFVETNPGLSFKSWREVEEPTPESLDAGG